MKSKTKNKVFICCDCEGWSEKKPAKCPVCDSLCFTQEELEECYIN